MLARRGERTCPARAHCAESGAEAAPAVLRGASLKGKSEPTGRRPVFGDPRVRAVSLGPTGVLCSASSLAAIGSTDDLRGGQEQLLCALPRRMDRCHLPGQSSSCPHAAFLSGPPHGDCDEDGDIAANRRGRRPAFPRAGPGSCVLRQSDTEDRHRCAEQPPVPHEVSVRVGREDQRRTSPRIHVDPQKGHSARYRKAGRPGDPNAAKRGPEGRIEGLGDVGRKQEKAYRREHGEGQAIATLPRSTRPSPTPIVFSRNCHTYGMTTTELKAAIVAEPTMIVNSVTLMRAFQKVRPASIPYALLSAVRIACTPDDAVQIVTKNPMASSAWLRWLSTWSTTG